MEKKYNIDLLGCEVSTQYGDMKGLASIDGHEMISLFQLCSDNGINMDEWFLLGLNLYDSEPLGTHDLSVTVLLIAKEHKEEGYDEISKRIKSLKEVAIHKKRFSISYQNLGQYVKRLNVGVVSDLSKYIQSADFVEG